MADKPSAKLAKPGTTQQAKSTKVRVGTTQKTAAVKAPSQRLEPPRLSFTIMWKIFLAFVGVVVLGVMGVFFVVYGKSQSLVESEIDAKGTRVTKSIALFHDTLKEQVNRAGGKSPGDSFGDLFFGIYDVFPENSDEKLLLANSIQAYMRESQAKEPKDVLYNYGDDDGKKFAARLLKERYWPSLKDLAMIKRSIKQVLTRYLVGSKREPAEEELKEIIKKSDDISEKYFQSETFSGKLDGFLLPARFSSTFNSFFTEIMKDMSDVKQISVDVSGLGHPLTAVPATEQTFESSGGFTREAGGVKIADGRIKQTGEHGRLFNYKFGDLEINVILSSEDIERSIAAMRNVVLVPVVFAIVFSIGVSFLVAGFITKPLKMLMGDLQKIGEGDLDHRSQVASHDEVGLLAFTVNEMTGLIKRAHETELEAQKHRKELELGRVIQAGLLPKQIPRPQGWDLNARYVPQEDLGGDLWDVIQIGDRYIVLIVADVTGHGIPASLIMSLAHGFLRLEIGRHKNLNLVEVLGGLNQDISKDIKKGMFITLMICVVDLATGQIKMASAGHNPLILYRGGTKNIELHNPKGMAVGIAPDAIFMKNIHVEDFVLNKGDRIVLYTDGIPEAMNEKSEQLGDEALQDAVKKFGHLDSMELLSKINDLVEEHRGTAKPSDDITIATLKRV